MPRLIRKLSMHKALKLGYLRDEKKQAKRLKRYGYVLDKELSSNERMVAYNPFSKKVLYVTNGSEPNPTNTGQFLKDWRSNVFNVPTGTFTYTPRFQEEKNAYLKTKKKYGEEVKYVLAGHSQGAISVNELAKGNDRGLTFNGALVKQKDNPNVINYRNPNDIVSLFANPADMKTLYQQPNMRTFNPLASHSVDTLKNVPIFL